MAGDETLEGEARRELLEYCWPCGILELRPAG